jgi:hypothetical protein
MTPEQIARAVILLDALSGIDDVRNGLKEKLESSDNVMRFWLGAYEDEGDGNGVGHGNALLPVEYAEDLLALAEKKLRAELAELGVVP